MVIWNRETGKSEDPSFQTNSDKWAPNFQTKPDKAIFFGQLHWWIWGGPRRKLSKGLMMLCVFWIEKVLIVNLYISGEAQAPEYHGRAETVDGATLTERFRFEEAKEEEGSYSADHFLLFVLVFEFNENSQRVSLLFPPPWVQDGAQSSQFRSRLGGAVWDEVGSRRKGFENLMLETVWGTVSLEPWRMMGLVDPFGGFVGQQSYLT